MTEVEKLHGLHNTGLTMHERFSLLAQNAIGRRKRFPLQAKARGQGRTNPALIETIVNQLNQAYKSVTPFRGRGRGRGRGSLRRAGSEGSLSTMPGLRRNRTNSFGHVDQIKNNQKWRSSNGNLSNYAGSVNGSVYSAGSGKSHGYWLRGDANQRARGQGRGRGRPRGRNFRGRVHQGRVNRISEPVGGGAWRTRGSGRRGMRRNTVQAVQGQPRGRGPSRGRGLRGRGRGRGGGGISRNQTPKPVPTKEELDAQLDQYMAGTKSALDKELDDYMRNAMEFD